MNALVALLALQARDPYAALGAALPPKEWEAVQAYVGEGFRRGPPAGTEGVKPPVFASAGATPLAVQRAAVDRWAPILAGLRGVTNQPYPSNPLLTMDDFVLVKSLQRFVVYAAHVRFADGDRHGAVAVLLDGLTMARRIRGNSTTGNLVGIACESLVLGGLEEHLSQIPLGECDRIRRAADAVLAEGVVLPTDANPDVHSALADAPAHWMGKGVDPILTAFAKEQTQMRLLRLHMRIEAYRWQRLSLPSRLVDAALATEIEDPLTQAPFHYEARETDYRLYSEGFPERGPMGLRYHRDPNLSDLDAPIEPHKP